MDVYKLERAQVDAFNYQTLEIYERSGKQTSYLATLTLFIVWVMTERSKRLEVVLVLLTAIPKFVSSERVAWPS